jgi:hypothetical protein
MMIIKSSKEHMLWLSGSISFLLAGLGLAAAMIFVILSEGPNADPMNTLASPEGRQVWNLGSIWTLVGGIACVIGFAILFSWLRRIQPTLMTVVLSVAILSGAQAVAMAAFNFSLVLVAKQGYPPENLELYTFAAHGFRDVAGWVLIGGFAFCALLVSLVLRRLEGWKLIGYAGIVIALIGLVIFPAEFSYLFIFLFSSWLVSVALAFFGNRKTIHVLDNSTH